MKGRGDAQQPTCLRAASLCADHIGSLIRFRLWSEPEAVVTIVTAELRQVSHDMEGTHIRFGEQAARESTLSHVDFVILRPAEDYSDVANLLGNDHEAVQWGRQ